ncbi:carbohydrate ABC transporter permease [Caldicellulosiruptoraceae bacterium PP1]
MSRSDLIKKIIITAIISILCIIWIVPLIWMLSTSLKPEYTVVKVPPEWIPHPFSLENYIYIFKDTYDAPIIRWFLNSLFVASVYTLLVVIVDSLAAYGYARLNFKGRELLFWLLMATYMIPPVMNLIPSYIVVYKFNWIDTYYPMIIPGLAGVFGVFLLRQFFKTIPKEYDESAYIDGASNFVIYKNIILPLSKPALVTLAVFSFMGNWNDFLWPLIVTNDTFMRTLPVGLSLFQGKYVIEFGKMMAGATVSALPAIILFLFTQRFFVRGITMSGLKG